MYPLVNPVPEEYCPNPGHDIDGPAVDQEYIESLYQELEREYAGHVLAIEPETGQYFVGEDVQETVRRAKEALPDVPLFFQPSQDGLLHKGSFRLTRSCQGKRQGSKG
jgi:hypothetical protein